MMCSISHALFGYSFDGTDIARVMWVSNVNQFIIIIFAMQWMRADEQHKCGGTKQQKSIQNNIKSFSSMLWLEKIIKCKIGASIDLHYFFLRFKHLLDRMIGNICSNANVKPQKKKKTQSKTNKYSRMSAAKRRTEKKKPISLSKLKFDWIFAQTCFANKINRTYPMFALGMNNHGFCLSWFWTELM